MDEEWKEQAINAGLLYCAMVGYDGEIFSSTNGFGLQESEAKTIVSLLDTDNQNSATSLLIENNRHLILRSSEDCLYTRRGTEGSCICKIPRGAIIGYYDYNLTPSAANVITHRIADYYNDATWTKVKSARK